LFGNPALMCSSEFLKIMGFLGFYKGKKEPPVPVI
jgi:hypothetical protein